nr:MAG TPA_asm: hypothetical protein [Caudoviricetes sp.]
MHDIRIYAYFYELNIFLFIWYFSSISDYF